MVKPEPRHIAVFVYALTGGGAQRRTLTLARGFAARGHRVDLVVVRSGGALWGDVPASIRVVPLDSKHASGLHLLVRAGLPRGLQTLASTGALAHYLRRERPDVLLSAASHVNLVSVWARRLSATRTPLALRASNFPIGNPQLWPVAQRPVRRFLQWMAGRVYPWADVVIAVSEGVGDAVAELTGIARERIVTIYNPVVGAELTARARAPVSHPWLEPGGTPVILGAGTLKVQKDFPTLIRAFARLRTRRRARLVIIGEGHQRHRLEALVRSLAIEQDVALPGFVPNPPAWMSRASVFVLSSAWEGLPGALIEAMACGCPVVSTDCPSGPAEILDDGSYGPLVPVGDDAAMADAIATVLEKPTARERLRARARDFAVEPAVERYLEVLLALAQGRLRAPAPASSPGAAHGTGSAAPPSR